MQDQILVEMPIHGSSSPWNIGTDTGLFTRKSNKQMFKQVKDGKGFNLGIKHN